MSKWDILHVNSLEVEQGIDEEQIRQRVSDGTLSQDDCVRRPGEDHWWRIYEVPEFRGGESAGDAVDESPVPSHATDRTSQATEPRDRARGASAPPAPSPAPNEPAALEITKKIIPEQEDIDMAPACTVSFLLILFFVIVSTVAIQMAIAFPKPAADDTQSQSIPKVEDVEKDNIMVEIKADNTIWINQEQIKEVDLVSKISTIRRDSTLMNLMVKAEDEAYHQTVVAVIDAATLAGIENVRMAAVTKAKKKAIRKRAVKS